MLVSFSHTTFAIQMVSVVLNPKEKFGKIQNIFSTETKICFFTEIKSNNIKT